MVIDHPFSERNISVRMCESAITRTTPLCLCLKEVLCYNILYMFLLFFQEGVVFWQFFMFSVMFSHAEFL
jgi:hypothetical protein